MVAITLSSLRLICAQQQGHLQRAASIYICFTSVKHFVNSLDAFFFYVWPRDTCHEDCLTNIHTDAQIKKKKKKWLLFSGQIYYNHQIGCHWNTIIRK